MKENKIFCKQHELYFWKIPFIVASLINNCYGTLFICNSGGFNCISGTTIMLSGFKT